MKKFCTVVFCSLASVVLHGADPAAAKLPDAPAGFTVERVAGEPRIRFPMFAVFDERGRLYVAESSGQDLYAELTAHTRKCRVTRLEDRDGDGRFESAVVFADQLVFPMGLAWRDGRLFVADPPDLAAFEDTDGDGRADRRTVILSGFGHTDNGSLHGIIFGPDDRLYMTMGQPDGYRFQSADGRLVEGTTGALIRSQVDGSQPEVVCRGFENLVEVVFLPGGEIIGTDNWFRRPAGGIRDALVHLVEEGLYPRYADRGTPQLVTGDPLPAVALFPAVALSGLVRYEGAVFPAGYRGDLFSAQHNSRKVVRHRLIRAAESFRSEDTDFVTSEDPDFHPSDVLEDADGSLLVVDTGGWYVQHCPTGKIRNSGAPGGIYRVRFATGRPPADPHGRLIDWGKASPAALAGLLDDGRPAVREQARRALIDRGGAAVPALETALHAAHNSESDAAAIRALAAIGSDKALAFLRGLLGLEAPGRAALAARVLEQAGDRQAGGDLARLLRSGSAEVRLAAAEALARCGSAEALTALWEALDNDIGPFERHAIIRAIYHLASDTELVSALQRPSARAQAAALLLLDQPPHRALEPATVLARVWSADPVLSRTARRVLERHPEWATLVLGFFRSWIGQAGWKEGEEGALTDFVRAFQSNGELLRALGTAVEDGRKQPDEERRQILLRVMAVVDPGRVPASWAAALRAALREPALQAEALRAVAMLRVATLDHTLRELAAEMREPTPIRLQALAVLVTRQPRLSSEAFDLVLEGLRREQAPALRLAASVVLSRALLDPDQLRQLLLVVGQDPLASPGLIWPVVARSFSDEDGRLVLDYLQRNLQGGWRPSEESLREVLSRLETAFPEQVARVRENVRTYAERQKQRLAAFEPLLSGGDAHRGRAIFYGPVVGCSTCHRINREGGWVGPDLTKVGAIRSGRDLLESVLFPSSTFAQGYVPYSVVTKSGQEAGGVLAEQSAADIVLRDSSGAERRFQREEVAELRPLNVSIMPEGLGDALTRDQLRDLLAFLQSLK